MTKDVVCKLFLSDVDDPAIYAAGPIHRWEKSAAGQWVIKHSKEMPIWYLSPNYEMFGYTVSIVADLSPDHWTFFHLKFSNTKVN